MADFANTLSSVLKRNRIYATHIAAASGVERSLISRVMKNERTVSFHTVKRIIDNINVPSEDHELLIRSFIEDNFGYQKYLEYLKLLKEFSMHDYSNKPSGSGNNISVQLEFSDGIMDLNSKTEIINVARHIISLETERSDGKVYSNIPTGMMVEIMRSFPDKPIDFKYIIDNFFYEKEKLLALSDVFNLMHIGYVCNYFPLSKQKLHLNFLFPHYIITNDYILIIDLFNETGFLSANKSVIEKYVKVFLNNFEKTTPYIIRLDDIMKLKEINASYFARGIEKTTFLHSFGCFATAYLELDMWEQIAKPDVPNRNFLRDTTYKYYQETYGAIDKDLCNISSKESLAEFVDYGIIKSMPREFAYPLNKENRVKVLEKMYNRFQSDDLFFYLYNDTDLKLGSEFGIEIYDNTFIPSHMMLYYPTENCQLHFCGNLNFLLDDAATTHDFAEFVNCFALSDYCYSKEKSLKILQEEILRCKMLPEE